MSSITGIELGPDTCVLAGVRATRSGADILALHTIEPAAWPAHDATLAEVLRGVRKSKRFPKRARVVAWGLSEDEPSGASRAAMRPLVDAGFRIDRVVTPPQGLAILAGTRVRPGVQPTGVAWLALNMHGAAIAIVRGGELLFARTFQWTYNPHLLDTKAQLLQRYSLISHLAPELRRGIEAVRASRGIPVDGVVTCGDLPELRSLTMPLIEELDLEVETLDSMEGLRPVGKARLERLAEAAPALRLACAAALAGTHRPRTGLPPVARIAAVVTAVAALGYGAYAYFNRVTAPAAPPRAASTVTKRPAQPAAQTTAAKLPAPTATAPSVQPNIVARPPVMSSGGGPIARKPPAAVPPKLPTQPRPANNQVAPVPGHVQSTTTKTPSPPGPEVGVSKPDLTVPPPVPATPPKQERASPADTRGVMFPRPSVAASQAREAPLREPLPKVDSILIDQERRLAIIDGAVATIGDQIGPRVLVQVDREGVSLREPSGLVVRVPLRSK